MLADPQETARIFARDMALVVGEISFLKVQGRPEYEALLQRLSHRKNSLLGDAQPSLKAVKCTRRSNLWGLRSRPHQSGKGRAF